MAKESPWFKFFTGEWANGSITLEDYSIQGVFINACCYYWSNEGQVTEKKLRKKIRSNEELDTLFEEGIIKVEGEKIIIKFLDEQMIEREEQSKKASEAGKKSAAAREARRQQAFNERSTTVKIPLNQNSTNKNKSKKENKNKIIDKEEDLKKELFESFWNLYDKKTSPKEKTLKKFKTLKEEEINLIFDHVPKYVNATPEKKYRKDPLTYLNQKAYENEIIGTAGGNAAKNYQNKTTAYNSNNTHFEDEL